MLHAEVLLATGRRLKQYKANEDRVFSRDGRLFHNYYGETGSVKYYKIIIVEQLASEVLRRLHGEFGEQTGITKRIIFYR